MTVENNVPSAVPARPATAPAIRASRPLRPKRERFAVEFARTGNASGAYRKAFKVTPDASPRTVKQRAYELAHDPGIAARVREILAESVGDSLIAARARMARLQAIAEADPSEIFNVEIVPCPKCWGDGARAVSLACGTEPDTTVPQGDCDACQGQGVPKLRLTPSESWSASARALVRSVRQKGDEVEIRLHDQIQAVDILNKMQGQYVDRSLSVNLTAELKPLRKGLTVEEALAIMESVAPSPADPVVSEQ